MSIFKCKMCGGNIEIEQGETVGVCDSCGTKQTLPRLDDDRKINLYDRANHFRRNNEYDKATGIYEQILNEDRTDSEAYWSLVLCRYGIEYVEDPATHKRVPTINRTQFTSIFDDDNYRSAIKYADIYQKSLYEEEANTINEIQKGILSISQEEEPFDVFICYKDTDPNGRRTPDSVLANDLYHQLSGEGFKVFYSRITLEDKLGTAYEPYIFAALNTAKVMVVLGTKPEYFNAVWVKNEWSRYLALVKQSGGSKVLIPAYRDMDPYDLPEEFSHLQALDMSKLGFMQDLIRGIKKIASPDISKTDNRESGVYINSTNTDALLRRAFMFLEDKNWHDADEYCERVLDLDPENAEAYLGKLMSDLRVGKREKLADLGQPFEDNSNYQKALRFSDDNLSSELKGYISNIRERIETGRLTEMYNKAVETMNLALTYDDYKAAEKEFRKIPGFKDSDLLADRCIEYGNEYIYNKASGLRNSAEAELEKFREGYGDTCSSVNLYFEAASEFEKIPGWKDAEIQAEECNNLATEAYEETEYICGKRYIEKAPLTSDSVESALEHFKGIAGYKDTDYLIEKYTGLIPELTEKEKISAEKERIENKYREAVNLASWNNKDNYVRAVSLLKTIPDYGDAKEKIREYRLKIREFEIYDDYLTEYPEIKDADTTYKLYNSLKDKKYDSYFSRIIKNIKEHLFWTISFVATLLACILVLPHAKPEAGVAAFLLLTILVWLFYRFYKACITPAQEYIENRNKETSQLQSLTETVGRLEKAPSFEEYLKLYSRDEDFNQSSGYASDKSNVDDRKKEDIYKVAVQSMGLGTIASYELAADYFSSIPEWKDSSKRIALCRKRIEELQREEKDSRDLINRKKKKRKLLVSVIVSVLIIGAVLAFCFIRFVIPKLKYDRALSLLESEEYTEAYPLLRELGKTDEITSNMYERALSLIDKEQYEDAYVLLRQIGKHDAVVSNIHERAMKLIKKKKYEEAFDLLEQNGETDFLHNCQYEYGLDLFSDSMYEEAKILFENLGDFKDSNEQLVKCETAIKDEKYAEAFKLYESEHYEDAIGILESIPDYKDSGELITTGSSILAESAAANKEYLDAVRWYKKAGNKDEVLKNEYQYVRGHQDNADSNTFEFLKDLAKKNYKDSDTLYQKLFGIKVTVLINNSQSNTSNHMTSVKGRAYTHVLLSGSPLIGLSSVSIIYEWKNVDSKGKSSTRWLKHTNYGINIHFNQWYTEESYYQHGLSYGGYVSPLKVTVVIDGKEYTTIQISGKLI